MYQQAGSNAWGPDIALDWRDERTVPNTDGSTHESADPMKEQPVPMLAADPPNRVEQLTWTHDWLANMTSWGDDTSDEVGTDNTPAFYERSIGFMTPANRHDDRSDDIFVHRRGLGPAVPDQGPDPGCGSGECGGSAGVTR